ncbi:MAG: hypothetical protein HYV62_07730 [Candidatus Rokubacteria bacterium]|nr:hypothetical protein [Candidatus Rokubacteria bacterium]
MILPVRLEPDAITQPGPADALASDEAAVRAIAGVMVTELGLPLPTEFTVFVHPTTASYAEGLARAGEMPGWRAAEIAAYSVGLSQHRRVFINADVLGGRPRSTWLGLVAHELTHLAQYELSGGRRGASEQWLREGMADWVACRILERLGESSFSTERNQAILALAQDLATLEEHPVDLTELGNPGGWEARHLRSGDRLTYRLAFLLTDELISRYGFGRMVAYFRTFADSDDRPGNFERVFGLPLSAFESEAVARIRHEVVEASGTGPATPPRRRQQ